MSYVSIRFVIISHVLDTSSSIIKNASFIVVFPGLWWSITTFFEIFFKVVSLWTKSFLFVSKINNKFLFSLLSNFESKSLLLIIFKQPSNSFNIFDTPNSCSLSSIIKKHFFFFFVKIVYIPIELPSASRSKSLWAIINILFAFFRYLFNFLLFFTISIWPPSDRNPHVNYIINDRFCL